MRLSTKKQGQSLVEVIIAMAVFGLVSAALVGLVLNGDQALRQGDDEVQAAALAQEGMEAVRSIRDNAWNNLTFINSLATTSNNQWVFGQEGDSENIGKYTRTISFADICRDGTGQIVGQTQPSLVAGATLNSAFSTSTWGWTSGTYGDQPPNLSRIGTGGG
ncbi:MAG: prepilin-type N-terminal cleavage/methylation domain-containing protein, partial [Candidatus Falkowbacteria bacterium]|nr:prepilin-type N-terminal cleavage/methylation domain-containing protein [Candidatus Falkowbacteria bacterium]